MKSYIKRGKKKKSKPKIIKWVYCGSVTEEQLNAFHALHCVKQPIEKYRQRLSTRLIKQSHDSYIKLG